MNFTQNLLENDTIFEDNSTIQYEAVNSTEEIFSADGSGDFDGNFSKFIFSKIFSFDRKTRESALNLGIRILARYLLLFPR